MQFPVHCKVLWFKCLLLAVFGFPDLINNTLRLQNYCFLVIYSWFFLVLFAFAFVYVYYLQYFCSGFQQVQTKTRTTDCHPVIEVVGYHCRRIINSVARGVYIILVKVCITHKRTSASTCFLSANETSYISMTKINKRWQTL